MAQAAQKKKLFAVRPRGSNRESRLASAMGVNVAAALAEVLDRLADDTYNAAVLNNPSAFAATQGRESSVAVLSEETFRAYRNDLDVPVVVVVRADGADVAEILASGSAFIGSEAQVRGQNQITMVLRPRQDAWVSVRAGFATAVKAITTAIPLRGKATVFGG